MGLFFILLGLAYYLFIRSYLPLFGLNISVHTFGTDFLPSSFMGSFPSFAFVIGLVLIESIYAQSRNKKYFAFLALKWICLAVFFELLQISNSFHFLSGVFDFKDIIASVLGGVCGFAFIISSKSQKSRPPMLFKNIPRNYFVFSTYCLSLFMLTATSKYSEPVACIDEATLVEAKDILWSKPRPISKNGKIGLYNDTLFISDGGEGLHVVDNSDRKNPIAAGFIEIPGNSDIAMKDGIVYADAYHNLVVLDISKLPEINVLQIIPEALGEKNDSCKSKIQNNEALSETSISPIVFPNRSIESVSVEQQELVTSIEITCLFKNEFDACMILTESLSKTKLLSGCLAQGSTSRNSYSCSVEVPLLSKIIDYASVCDENKLAVINHFSDEELQVDFSEDTCVDANHFNEMNDLFKNKYDAFLDNHILNNTEESIISMEKLFHMKEIIPSEIEVINESE